MPYAQPLPDSPRELDRPPPPGAGRSHIILHRDGQKAFLPGTSCASEGLHRRSSRLLHVQGVVGARDISTHVQEILRKRLLKPQWSFTTIRSTTISSLEEVLIAVHQKNWDLLPALFEPTDADLEYERQLLAFEAEIKADLAVLYEAGQK